MIQKRSAAIINKRIIHDSETPISASGEAKVPHVQVSYREAHNAD